MKRRPVFAVARVTAPTLVGVAALLCCKLAAASVAVYAWGNNSNGQVGVGSTAASVAVPTAVPGLTSSVTLVGSGVVDGYAVQNGAVLAWGSNTYGQLGTGTAANSSSPVSVVGLGSGVSAIAGGTIHTLAIQNGAAYAWGFNGIGELGTGAYASAGTPTPVVGLTSGVTAIAAGYAHSLAVQNGAAYAWGYNGFGQLGIGTTDNDGHPTPVAVSGLTSGVTAVSAGYASSMAIQNGAVFAWGSNNFSPLGTGVTDSKNYPTPTAVVGLGSGVTAIACGMFDSLAVQNGKVYAWGQETYGQLGDGNVSTISYVPVPVVRITGTITSVAAGAKNSYALAADGSIWDWGDNSSGGIGVGTTTGSYLPHHLLAPAGYAYTSVATGFNGSHVITTLAHPDAGVGSTAVGAVLQGDAQQGLVLSSPTVSGSVALGSGGSGGSAAETVLLTLDAPSQGPALIADLNNVYGAGTASAASGTYQVTLTLPTTAGSANYFNFDFTTVVGAGPVDPLGTGQSELASVAVDAIAITAAPEPASLGLLVTAVGGGLLGPRRRRRRCA